MLHRILTGHLLGDGHIARVNKGNSYFVTHRSSEHHDYNIWTKKVLSKEGLGFTDTYPKIGKSDNSYLRSRRGRFWSEYRKIWYLNGKKILPRDYVRKNMDEISFAIWFFDDGDRQGRISTDSFSFNDVLFLRDLIREKFGFRMNIYNQTGRENHRILRASRRQALENLRKTVISSKINIPCVGYKLGAR